MDLDVLRVPKEGPWRVRVVGNRYPALSVSGRLERQYIGLQRRISGVGYHEVIIESPRHNTCAALQSPQARHTALTNLFTGRPSRGIVNRIMRELGPISSAPPAFPLATSAIAPLRAKAEAAGSGDFSPLWSGQNAVPFTGASRAVPLGLVIDPPLDVIEIDIPAGATLLLYTDGVTDAIDESATPFGRARLIETVERNVSLPAQALCNAIVSAVLAHQGTMPQFDDVTVLALHLD